MSEPMPLTERIYWRLPRLARRAIANGVYAITPPIRRVLNSARSFAPSAYRICGERHGEPLALLYAGGAQGAHYYAQRMSDVAVPESLKRASLKWLDGNLPADCGDPDILVMEMDRVFTSFARRAGALIAPQWVGFKCAIDQPGGDQAATAGNESLRSDLRAIRRAELQLGTTHDASALDTFYDEMYLPHLMSRHGAAARRSSRYWMRRLMEKGALIQAFQRGEFVGGSVVIRRGCAGVAMTLGERLDSDGRLRPGVSAALYQGVIRWSREQGCQEVDFGHCRPVLNDGLVRYKRKWKMSAQDDRGRVDRILAVKIRRLGAAVLRFLTENPFFALEPDRLAGWIFDETAESLDAGELERRVRSLMVHGLAAYRVASPGGAAPGAAEAASAKLGVSVRGAVLDERWPPAVSAA